VLLGDPEAGKEKTDEEEENGMFILPAQEPAGTARVTVATVATV
jgi:hypothetical protein